jgi:hydrogenase maturation protease
MTVAALRTLIVGIGHPWRGDDAAGLLAAAALAKRGDLDADVAAVHGTATDLLDLWAGRRRVVVLDAVAAPCYLPGTVVVVDAAAGPLPAAAFAVSSHALGLREAVELARALAILPAELLVVGIVGARFDFGEGLSPAVQAAVNRIVEEQPWRL